MTGQIYVHVKLYCEKCPCGIFEAVCCGMKSKKSSLELLQCNLTTSHSAYMGIGIIITLQDIFLLTFLLEGESERERKLSFCRVFPNYNINVYEKRVFMYKKCKYLKIVCTSA